MTNWILIGAGISLGLAIAALLIRRAILSADQPSAASGSLPVTRNQPPRKKRRYYGVSVKAGVNTCDAVDAIRNQRFLLEEAPKFPLPNCNRSDCQCVAIPEDDRRAASDRRAYTFTAYGDYNPNAYFEKREEVKRERRNGEPVN